MSSGRVYCVCVACGLQKCNPQTRWGVWLMFGGAWLREGRGVSASSLMSLIVSYVPYCLLCPLSLSAQTTAPPNLHCGLQKCNPQTFGGSEG